VRSMEGELERERLLNRLSRQGTLAGMRAR
jgi:hypothetical protein